MLGSVACDTQSSDGGATQGTPSAEAKPPVSANEAREIAKDLKAKNANDSLNPAYWRKIHAGPWLDRTLAEINNIKKRGRDDPEQRPTNRPEVDSTVHAWVTKPGGGSGDWIFSAQQTSGHTIGDGSKNKAHMSWNLHHRADDEGAWRTAFTTHADSKKDLPELAADKSGIAQTVETQSDLPIQPGNTCSTFIDYTTGKNRKENIHWSPEIDQRRATYGDTKEIQKEIGNAESVKIETEGRRDPVGPAWRTKDGAVLVPCVSVNTTTTEMGSGRWIEFTWSGWDGTTGIRWNKFTQRMMTMTMLKVPVDGTEISIAAESTWPYKFSGSEHKGN